MLYQITDGTVSVGGETILSHVDFEIRGTEKIGIVGSNGAGKTTLLRLLAGELTLDRDDHRQGPGIRFSRKLTMEMLHQTQNLLAEQTVEELVLMNCPEGERFSRERYAYEMEFDRLFTGLGFEKSQKSRKLGSFSGGEQTKIALMNLLLRKPDILLLDEPTNHLDVEAAEWLEQYLQEYEHAVVLVSHDRFFLDQAADVIYEIEDRKLARYPGNYTHYREQKAKEREEARKAYERQQKEVERLEGLIERFKHKPRKASFARSRQTILDRMERMPKPGEGEAHFFVEEIVPEVRPNKWIMEAKELKIGYEKPILELSLRVRSGQKIGIIGSNGAGKTTLLKTIVGEMMPLDGICNLGERTTLGFFDQQSASLSSTESVLEHYHNLFPVLTEKEVRQNLGAFLFRGKAAGTRVCDLSGGEKSRLVLAELLNARPNLLVLDEPTNHMDIPAKETLESAFRAYKGTILFVSHDRYFLSQVADAVLVLDGDHVMYYPFGYSHYLERKRREDTENPAALIRAEEQAMLEDFRAVPEKERHRLREISTESAYLDWRFRLAAEPLEEVTAKVELLYRKKQEFREEIPEVLEEWFAAENEVCDVEYESAVEEWTQACLEWYEVYEQLESGE